MRKTMKIKRIRKLTGIAILLGLFLCGCSKSAKEYTQDISDYVSQYNDGAITYEDAYQKLDDIYYETDNSEVQETVENQKQMLDSLKVSKEAFASAEAAEEKENYKEAIGDYDKVIAEDSNYDAAQDARTTAGEKYLESVRTLGQTYEEEKKYEKAIDCYSDSKSVYDNGSADEWIGEAENAYKESLESDMAAYEEEGNYETAIARCEDLYEYFKEETYSVKKEELENEWINSAIAEAEQYLSQGDYANAKKVVNSASNKIDNDDELEAELARIEEFVPVRLMDLNVFSYEKAVYSNDLQYIDSSRFTDNTGASYTDGILLRTYDVPTSVTFLVDEKYDILTGKFVLNQDSKNYDFNSVLYIYGDDVLLYTSDVMTKGVRPIDVSVNISGVTELKIETKAFNHNGNYVNTVAFVDPILSKAYTPLDGSSVSGDSTVTEETTDISTSETEETDSTQTE